MTRSNGDGVRCYARSRWLAANGGIRAGERTDDVAAMGERRGLLVAESGEDEAAVCGGTLGALGLCRQAGTHTAGQGHAHRPAASGSTRQLPLGRGCCACSLQADATCRLASVLRSLLRGHDIAAVARMMHAQRNGSAAPPVCAASQALCMGTQPAMAVHDSRKGCVVVTTLTLVLPLVLPPATPRSRC